jgi:phosphatidylserine synthase
MCFIFGVSADFVIGRYNESPSKQIIIIVIIIINIGIYFMQGIYTHIPEKNHVRMEHRVAAILVLLFIVRISLVPVLPPLYLYVIIIIIIYYHHHHHHRYLQLYS